MGSLNDKNKIFFPRGLHTKLGNPYSENLTMLRDKSF